MKEDPRPQIKVYDAFNIFVEVQLLREGGDCDKTLHLEGWARPADYSSQKKGEHLGLDGWVALPSYAFEFGDESHYGYHAIAEEMVLSRNIFTSGPAITCHPPKSTSFCNQLQPLTGYGVIPLERRDGLYKSRGIEAADLGLLMECYFQARDRPREIVIHT